MDDELKCRLLEFLELLVEDFKTLNRKIFDIPPFDGGELSGKDSDYYECYRVGTIKGEMNSSIHSDNSIVKSKLYDVYYDSYHHRIERLILMLKEENPNPKTMISFMDLFKQHFSDHPHSINIFNAVTKLFAV